jgi:hypothetical protein
MIARCLVYELRDGTKCYDRLYGDPIRAAELKLTLENNGYVAINKVHYNGTNAVVGNVPQSFRKPYFDNLSSKTMVFKNKKVHIVLPR